MYTCIKQVIHIAVQQKLTPQCKPIVLQLKIKIKIKKAKGTVPGKWVNNASNVDLLFISATMTARNQEGKERDIDCIFQEHAV